MLQFFSIARNTFMELVRQPVYLILLTGTLAVTALLANLYYFGFGDDTRLVKQSVLALMLSSGLLSAVLSASASLAQEIRGGTALAVLSKPVGRATFLLAKYAGLAAALTLQTGVSLLAALLASRMAFDNYGSPDKLALVLFFSALALAFVLAAGSNFFAHRSFIGDAVLAVTGLMALAFVLINFLNRDGALQSFGAGVDWRLVPAATLILFALLILAALALACTTRLDTIPTLAICTGLFLLGLMSDYVFGRAAAQGSWVAGAMHTVVPNWQLFWMADALEETNTIPWAYVTTASGYLAGYLVVALALALALFEDRELS